MSQSFSGLWKVYMDFLYLTGILLRHTYMPVRLKTSPENGAS